MTAPDLGRRLRAVWLAYADLATPPADVRDVNAWRDAVAADARQAHHRAAAALLTEHPDAPPELVAVALRRGGSAATLAEVIAAEDAAAAARRREAAGNALVAAVRAEPDRWELGPAGIAAARAALEEVNP